MKRITIIFFFLFSILPVLLTGQVKPNFVGQWYQRSSQGKTPVNLNAFSARRSDFSRTKRYNLRANMNQLNSILNTKPTLLNLVVPYGGKTYTLNLARVEIITEQFIVKTNQGNVSHNTGVQYRGIVDNNPAHVASLSLTQTDKSVFFSTGEGNFVITKEGNDYIFYNEREMPVAGIIFCETPNVTYEIPIERNLISGIGCKTVNVYFECDYAFYQNKGSNVSTLTDYVIGFFNQVATLYANEDIAIQISEIFVWTTPDPYALHTTPSTIMNAFKAARGTAYNGHIAHFLTTRNVGGGIAYVNTLCNKAFSYGVSRIYSTYSNFPTYSWTVNVVAHELGHNFGSPHTHSCSWSGGPLDNCQAPEGSCSPGPAPTGGGTIMSYCHTTSVGINFNNGFGMQPGNLIRSKVLNATCIPAGTDASPPTSLSTTNITSNSATLNWAAAPGATTYTVQYKLATATTWISAGTTSATTTNITGLSPNANYVWSVKSDCSVFATNASFITSGTSGCAAPTQLSSTNITQTGATLSWGAVTGSTGYTVQYKTSTASTWTTLTTTTNSRTITGLVTNTNYVWQVKASCSSYSAQASFVTASSTGCSAPAQLTSTNITQTGATLSWGAVTGSTGYTVQYKTSAASTWTTLTSTTNSRSISGLVANTNYVWQVKASCSSYSSQSSFVTQSSTSLCATPTNLGVTSITNNAATLTWSGPSNAVSYTIRYRLVGASGWTFRSNITGSSYRITNLLTKRNYQWAITVKCSNGKTSSLSVTQSFTTL